MKNGDRSRNEYCNHIAMHHNHIHLDHGIDHNGDGRIGNDHEDISHCPPRPPPLGFLEMFGFLYLFWIGLAISELKF